MILGIGNDLVDCRRIKKSIDVYGLRFTSRIFTVQEQNRMLGRVDFIAGYAKIFAMKEALLKALGTGLAQGIFWHDVEISRQPGQPPQAQFYRSALKILRNKILPGYCEDIHVSVSDEWPYAQAFAIISTRPLS
jgi:holo-[acyl-carrier protein] synthase